MNYAALEIDELARLCVTDPGARAYAGEHFVELIDRLEHEWLEQYNEGYDEAVSQAADALLDHELARIAPWYDLPPNSPYWRI